jgi:adenylate cyclase
VTTIPYYQALQLGSEISEGRKIDPRRNAVFVGLSEALLADRKDSFYNVFSQVNGLFISGVEIMASAWSNIMEDTPVKSARLL